MTSLPWPQWERSWAVRCSRYVNSDGWCRGAGLAAILVLLAGACASTPAAPSQARTTSNVPSTASPNVGELGAPGCRPPSPAGAFSGEVYGTATGGTIWGWFMEAYPPRAEIEDKVVWRLDSSNLKESPSLIITGPARQVGHLDWGPLEHGESSWARPGREFGTGLLFPAPGCWDIRVTLAQLTGHIYVVVT
jgi:hypothetical protein